MARSSALIGLLAACNGDPPVSTQPDACGPSVQYDTAAAPALTTWCTPCHSTNVTGDARTGAPVGVDFDTSAGVAMFAERIRARLEGPEPSMPPAGGIPDADRTSLVEWIDCGLPGLPEDPPPAPCENPVVVVPSDLTILCADAAVAVEGDLTIDRDVDLGCVCTVSGALEVRADATLPALTQVGGAVTVTATARIVNAPALASTGPLLVDADLEAFDLAGLTIVSGDVDVTGTSLTALDLSALATVAGTMTVRDQPLLTRVMIDRLRAVDGDLVFARLLALTELRGNQTLEAVGGSLIFEDLGPVDLDGFGNVASVGVDLVVRRTGAPSLSGFERWLVAPASVLVEANPNLESVWGLQDLQTVAGDVRFVDNAALVAIGSQLFELVAVDGDLVFEGNASLTTLPSLPSLVTVTGELRIRDNPVLPTALATELAARLVVGSVVIEGNAP